ncbi:hypothetical protein Scep_010375 [Stephania cephalantha]|uniref:Uncharacterized protein n=1 Tax=Stephania cephalantha TaxID=152367 RepID=A0AAP0PF54_9MAGN
MEEIGRLKVVERTNSGINGRKASVSIGSDVNQSGDQIQVVVKARESLEERNGIKRERERDDGERGRAGEGRGGAASSGWRRRRTARSEPRRQRRSRTSSSTSGGDRRRERTAQQQGSRTAARGSAAGAACEAEDDGGEQSRQRRGGAAKQQQGDDSGGGDGRQQQRLRGEEMDSRGGGVAAAVAAATARRRPVAAAPARQGLDVEAGGAGEGQAAPANGRRWCRQRRSDDGGVGAAAMSARQRQWRGERRDGVVGRSEP